MLRFAKSRVENQYIKQKSLDFLLKLADLRCKVGVGESLGIGLQKRMRREATERYDRVKKIAKKRAEQRTRLKERILF